MDYLKEKLHWEFTGEYFPPEDEWPDYDDDEEEYEDE